MVNSVTFPPDLGGDGSTYDDSANSATGMGDGGFRIRLIPMISQVINMARSAINSATAADASALTALNAPGTMATCATSIAATVHSGQAMTLAQTNKAYQKGMFLLYSSAAVPDCWFVAQLTAFVSSTGIGTLNIVQIGPTAGTHADWNVSMTGPFDNTLTGQVAALQAELLRLKGRRRLQTNELL